MALKRTYGCYNLRNMCISLGAVTTILWFIVAYLLFNYLLRIKIEELWIGNKTSAFTTMTCSITCVVVCACMTYGAFKSEPNLIFPWIAIHYAIMLYAFLTGFTFVLGLLGTSNLQGLYISIAIASILGSVMVISWNMVYVYYKRLMTEMREVQPTLHPNDGNTVQDSKSPEHPYHPI